MSSRPVMVTTRTTQPPGHHAGVVSDLVPLHIAGLPFTAQRFAPAQGATHPVPVILCLPFCCNHALFRARHSGPSLVERLCAAGRSVWTFNFRGLEAAYDVTARAHLRNGHGTPTLGDFAAMELHAVVQRALTDAAASQVDLVGLSMGGAVATAYAAMVAPAQVRRLAMVGSPLCWRQIPLWARLITRHPRAVAALPTASVHRVVAHAARHAHRIPDRLRPAWLAGADQSTVMALGAAVGPFAPAIHHAAASWVRHGVQWEGRTLWDSLPALHAPVFCAYSPSDIFAPADNVVPAVARMGTPRSQQQVVRIPDATHVALMVGPLAAQKIFPPLTKFLD